MMLPVPHAAPWTNPLDPSQRAIIYYFLVIAGLAMLAQFVRTWVSSSEIGPRYRPAMYASLGVTGVAFLSYVVLALKFDLGYTQSGGAADGTGSTWLPNKDAIWSWAPRFMDWSITVPLLMVQLIVVSTLVGAAARRYRLVAIPAAWLMIFTGYLGGVVIGDGESLAALWTWGVISGVFMVVLYVLIIAMVVKAMRQSRTGEVTAAFRSAAVLLLVVWFVYPIVFGFQGYTDHAGGWTVLGQVGLSAADIIAKVGYGALIHKICALRTAEDVASGEDVHPESVWTSNEKRSDAVLPPFRGAPGGQTDSGSSALPRTGRAPRPGAASRPGKG